MTCKQMADMSSWYVDADSHFRLTYIRLAIFPTNVHKTSNMKIPHNLLDDGDFIIRDLQPGELHWWVHWHFFLR